VSFSNPVTGGQGALIRPAIKSPNYVPGVSGWSINRTGSAEFNNLTVRGTFFGTTYVLNSLGAFFYNGAPALGSLILSIAAAPGADDGFGNAFDGGLATYAGGVDTFHLDGVTGNLRTGTSAGAHWLFDVGASQLSMFDLNAVLTARQSASVGNSNFLWLSNLAKQFFLINGGAVQIGSLTTAGTLPTGTDTANAAQLSLALGTVNSLAVRGQANTAAPGNIVPLVQLQGGSTGNTVPGSANNPVLQINPSAGAAIDVGLFGGAIYRSDLGGWQTATPNTGWANAAVGGRQTLQYRIGSEDNLILYGALDITTITPNVTAFTLAAGYHLAKATNITAIQLSSAGAHKGVGEFLVNASGGVAILTTSFAALASGDIFVFNSIMPVGNLP
jgi:hypothetical protein